MKIGLFLLLNSFMLFGCTHQPIVFDPKDKPHEATGSISKISHYFPKGKGNVKVILVHGVGDHCPGYGLDPEHGWLSEKHAQVIGLTKKDEKPSSPIHIPAYKFVDKPSELMLRDPFSRVSVVKQNFTYRVPGTSDISDVEVLEITWSELTQWLKTKQVGYDLTRPLNGAKNENDMSVCASEREDKSRKLAQLETSSPPPRVLANRLVKEQLLDRNLLDAVIYAGSYGINIQRGFAEALCTALSPFPPEGKCDWSKIPYDKNTQYIFVTHSLGSRIVFDTILGLDGVVIRPEQKDPIFNDKKAAGFIENMLAQTPVVYMMANQLAILGLANTPLTLSSLEPPIMIEESLPLERNKRLLEKLPKAQPPAINRNGNRKGNENPTGQRGSSSEAKDQGAPAKELLEAEEGSFVSTKIGNYCPINTLIKIAALKSRVGGEEFRRLDVISFDDTNDLLTWAIPSWYQNLPQCAPGLKIVNAFVQNAHPWMIFEDPLKAHEGYFENSEVWDLMRCGAEHGSVATCSSR